jgi:hypothetical protein
MPLLPLWVELYREGGRVRVDGCGFSEIEDAVDAVREFVAHAKRLHEEGYAPPGATALGRP